MENELRHKTIVITCPHCGAQYVGDEIFSRTAISGKPNNIIKDPLGKVLYTDYKDGEEPDFEEHFTCDRCKHPFIIEATVSVKVRAEEPELDFAEKTVSLW